MEDEAKKSNGGMQGFRREQEVVLKVGQEDVQEEAAQK